MKITNLEFHANYGREDERDEQERYEREREHERNQGDDGGRLEENTDEKEMSEEEIREEYENSLFREHSQGVYEEE